MKKKTHLFYLTQEQKRKLSDQKFLLEQLNLEKSGSEILGWKGEEESFLYQKAFHFFLEEKYEEAFYSFYFLVFLNGENPDFWLGFGMGAHKLGRYEEAIDAYEMAATCQLENPLPYLYLAKSFFAIHERKNALDALEMAIEYAKEKTEFEDIYKEALNAKKHLKELN